ncbi:hypothetical protein AVEN_108884-1 [Araneus ventricosus]|uniref:Uncharacterized protein n=1 Tax=Araneus ventricosus TaxID=182803 RepID=A0A4Y2SV82_ARAVE|nr:hypothetical protein AVEN_108884-1 [Araneus ventricosus]
MSRTALDASALDSSVFEFEEFNVKVCTCKDFVSIKHRRNLSEHILVTKWQKVGFYESVFKKPDWWNNSKIIKLSKESGLWSDTPVVFSSFYSYAWYHLLLTPAEFADFSKTFREKKDFAVLPHWCLCENLIDLTTSRHLIVAVLFKFKSKFEELCVF